MLHQKQLADIEVDAWSKVESHYENDCSFTDPVKVHSDKQRVDNSVQFKDNCSKLTSIAKFDKINSMVMSPLMSKEKLPVCETSIGKPLFQQQFTNNAKPNKSGTRPKSNFNNHLGGSLHKSCKHEIEISKV